MTLVETLHIEAASVRDERVEAVMPVMPDVLQPFGFVHGGATIALLETVASLGAQQGTDLESERPFGVDVHVRHRKAVASGTLLGVAELDRTSRRGRAASGSSGTSRPTTTKATSCRRASW